MKKIILLICFIFQFSYAQEVTFVAIHPNASEHFVEFAKVLEKNAISYQIIAAEIGAEIFSKASLPLIKMETWLHEKNINNLSQEERKQLIEWILSHCKTTTHLITDIGHPLMIDLHQIAKEDKNSFLHFAYYDNPQWNVPGEYSKNVQKILQEDLDGMIFANENLAKNVPLSKHSIGLGYYPLKPVDQLRDLRLKKPLLRKDFFSLHQLKEEGQKIILYVGGANHVYFSEGFPHFVSLLREVSQKGINNLIVVIQQHPRAIAEGNLDFHYLLPYIEELKRKNIHILFSSTNLQEIAATCDMILYFQTSLAPRFALAGIPIFQIVKKPFDDLLSSLYPQLCITQSNQFIEALGTSSFCLSNEEIIKGMGINRQWEQQLLNFLKDN